MANFINKRAMATSEAVTGDGDPVADVAAGRQKLDALKDDELPDNLRTLKPEQRMDEINKQMSQARSSTKGSPHWWRCATSMSPNKAPRRQRHSSFDRVVEDTLRAQIKR
jgi:hypothetical protein